MFIDDWTHQQHLYLQTVCDINIVPIWRKWAKTLITSTYVMQPSGTEKELESNVRSYDWHKYVKANPAQARALTHLDHSVPSSYHSQDTPSRLHPERLVSGQRLYRFVHCSDPIQSPDRSWMSTFVFLWIWSERSSLTCQPRCKKKYRAIFVACPCWRSRSCSPTAYNRVSNGTTQLSTACLALRMLCTRLRFVSGLQTTSGVRD